MKIFDMHMHARGIAPDPRGLLSAMGEVGVYGGCVISAPPKEQTIAGLGGFSFEERLAELHAWRKGSEDRIFPVLWIHPDEENILEKVRRAAGEGILAFKMICSDYYVSEERSMRVIREIARLGLPIVFHTGILWDGKVSSAYNRPLNWEALLNVDGIRFSMGHCSWPWIDECIALYGKFLNARRAGKRVEMFFDITPGTPEIYRRELLCKLYTIGYDVGDHVMFGLDSNANAWKGDWARKWLKVDGQILDELGVSLAYREKLYGRNLMSFLGKESIEGEIAVPRSDVISTWSAVNPETRDVIERWYRRLGFPSEFDAEFYRALDEIPISDAITLATYDRESGNGRRNLLSYLFFCEETARRLSGMGIPDETVTATLSDIVTWCITWSGVKGELYLGELPWLSRHLEGRLFRLGRLQFCMAEAERDIPAYGIKKGDGVLEIHIPEGEHLTESACLDAIQSAREFFARYFPDFSYAAFTCHSWLLDDRLKEYLGEGSGILRFAALFDKVAADESTALLRYLFTWDTTRLNLRHRYPTSSLAAKVQRSVCKGERFYEVLGVIPK